MLSFTDSVIHLRAYFFVTLRESAVACVTSSRLLGNTLVMSSLVRFQCLRYYRSRHNQRVVFVSEM